jgi:hypothetical protein
VTPLVDAVPAVADRLIWDANGLLPHLKITDLLAKRADATVAEVKGGHAIYVSQPKAVAELIEKAAMSLSTK